MQAFFKGYDREAVARSSYLSLARTDSEVPLMRHGDQYPYDSRAYSVATYDKMATNLIALRGLLGDEKFLRCYHEYGARWLNKHPSPWDFWNTFNWCSGQDLSWFWRTWWYETWTLDQAIQSVTPDGAGLRVTIEDKGLAPMPVRLAITRTTGATEQQIIPVDVWLKGARRTSILVPDAATITAIEIDPSQTFPDIDRSNNRWVKK
jgi:aminopeptidase N